MTNNSHIELLIGQMLVDDEYRKQNAINIPIDHIQDKELFIITWELQNKDFSLVPIYLKHNKKIIIRAIEAALSYAKKRILENKTITNI